MKRNLSTSLISSVFVAGMIVAGAVSAQPATKPLAAGDTATGMTKETQRPDGTMPASRAAVKAETRAAVRTPDATLPAGNTETVGGKKMDGPPRMTSGKTRAETRAETSRMPARGEQSPRQSSPTNQKNNSGSPQ
jgi:hypothetical protein